jgi:TetR/AcrR family transcriptional regulator of autoinduction and epiphytic fitness
MSAKKRDTSRKRESILSAAMQVFCDEGYDKASMDRIADVAGSSKRTVYNHFFRKEDLFQAVVERFVSEMHAMKQIRYDPSRSLEEQLSDFADAELAVATNRGWLKFIKVLLTVFIRDPDLAGETAARYAAGEDTLATWLHEAADDGTIAVDDAQLAARVFWSMLGGAFTWPAVYQGELDPEVVDRLKQELIATFLSRYRA